MRGTAIQQPAPPSDEDLITAASVHDENGVQAFGLLYDRHGSFVYGIARRFLRDPREAEDLLQDIFVKLWERQIRFKPGKARFTTWLYTVTRNRCLDKLKVSSRRGPILPLPDLSAAQGDDPESDSYASECCRRVCAAIAELPESQRKALSACAFQGLTHEAAAAALGIPLGTLKSRVKAAMSKIAGIVAESEGME